MEVLQKTRIGMTVNLLRKSVTDEQVVTLSKTLIKSWKKLLEDQNRSKPQKEDSNDSTNGSIPNSAIRENGSNKTSSTNNVNNGKSTNSTNLNNSDNNTNNRSPASVQRPTNNVRPLSFPSISTSDSVRLKCREMLYNSLNVEFGPEIDVKDEILEDPENLAAKIEDCIFKEFKETNMKYKNRIRSRVANLKDNKNPGNFPLSFLIFL